MAIKLPRRTDYSIPELMERWNCEENDIRRLLITEQLRPSYVVNHVASVVRFSRQPMPDLGEYWQSEVLPNDGDDHLEFKDKVVNTEGFYFLLFPHRTSAFDCHFVYLSKTVDFDRASGLTCLMLGGRAIPKITLDEVILNGVVFEDEVARFESTASTGGRATGSTKSSDTRKYDNLLRLVIAMAIDGYRYEPSAEKSPVPSEIAGAVERLGMQMSSQTVRGYLTEASETVLPGKPGQR
jgi:hypothetical protein